MTVTYQVGEGGHLDIDFWVRWPMLETLRDLHAPSSSQTLWRKFCQSKFVSQRVQSLSRRKRTVGMNTASQTR